MANKRIQKMNVPADQALRERFVNEIERNFSVIAPAGVGKTKAIVDRVVAIATGNSEIARAALPRLVVVTYTNKAADEMHQRARNAIIAARVGLPVLTQFNRAFFGTIHSFCVRLLRSHGHLCGLPTQFEPVENDDELWHEFVRQSDQLAPNLPTALVESVTRLLPVDSIFHLARGLRGGLDLPSDSNLRAPPDVYLQGVLDQTGTKSSIATIQRSQRAARAWQEAWRRGDLFTPLPKRSSNAKDFTASWENAFGPLREWLGPVALRVAGEIAVAYRAYRRSRGTLTYDDQIELAWELVRHPEAARKLRREELRVILDEAQDTDPLQFNILLELTRPVGAAGVWLEDGGAPPEPGRFCMVGDPQQSIYGERADLGWYRKVQEKLAADKSAEELIFSVTFRCDRAIIDAVNHLVQPMFGRTDGQVAYNPLQPRPEVGPGQVMRWTPERPPENVTGVNAVSVHEGRQLARWLNAQGLARLGANNWSEVAVLCPRTRWLQGLAIGLREEGLGPQIHSERAVLADNPVYAWFTALLTALTSPDKGFEVVGVLREIYGLADEELAQFSRGNATAWDLRQPPGGDAPTARVLRTLSALMREVAALPVRDAAQRAVEAVALGDRLRSLARADLAVDEELDALLAQAAEAENNGLSLSEFAEELRDKMNEAIPARPVVPDAVQLLTTYKAKGLQWPVVVLPLTFRVIGEPNTYPALVRSAPGEWPQIALASNDFKPMQDRVEQRRRQELQRLLYVGLTRAQRTLVLVDDDTLFPRKKANRSFATLLGMTGDDGSRIFNETWDALPNRLNDAPSETQSPRAAAVPSEPAPAAASIAEAVERLTQTPRRVLPYQLGEAEARAERELDAPETERSAGAEAAREYGIWWHDSIERIDWDEPAEKQRADWNQALASCPQRERGQREVELLLKASITERLRQPGLIRRREIPILWRRDEKECVEGIIDLAVWDERQRRWLIADWKTNLVAQNIEEHLRSIYTPQLRAYAEALHEISGAPVEAGVYSTCAGLWIPCATLS